MSLQGGGPTATSHLLPGRSGGKGLRGGDGPCCRSVIPPPRAQELRGAPSSFPLFQSCPVFLAMETFILSPQVCWSRRKRCPRDREQPGRYRRFSSNTCPRKPPPPPPPPRLPRPNWHAGGGGGGCGLVRLQLLAGPKDAGRVWVPSQALRETGWLRLSMRGGGEGGEGGEHRESPSGSLAFRG